MMKVVVALSALLFVAVSATPFRDCGSKWTLTAVRVPDCNALPCIVYRGSNYSVEYDAVATSETSTLTTDLKGTFSGVTLPWPGDFPPVCNTLVAGDCPVQVGESVTAATVLVLSSSFPQVNAKATWKLLGDDPANDPLVCFEVTVTLL